MFDAFDGRVARWRQKQSALGRELDSLADVISFGVAPAALGFGAGLDGAWDALVLVYFVKYFEGTPIPSSVLLVGLMALAAWRGHTGEAIWGGAQLFAGWTLHPLVLLYLLSGSLMISKTLRIPKL